MAVDCGEQAVATRDGLIHKLEFRKNVGVRDYGISWASEGCIRAHGRTGSGCFALPARGEHLLSHRLRRLFGVRSTGGDSEKGRYGPDPDFSRDGRALRDPHGLLGPLEDRGLPGKLSPNARPGS